MAERTVLFVDDDGIVLRSIARGLLDELYNMCFAKSGEEALEILRQQEVHVLVTDMRMPGMDGAELLKIVKKEYPHIVKMILSGYTNTTALTMAIHQEDVFGFIPKPWNLQEEEEFRAIIRQAIDHYNLQSEHAGMVEELK
ncbi:MAG: response regulator [Planctomycetota bacterium]|jgi:DNA-binding NtrC family response regulator